MLEARAPYGRARRRRFGAALLLGTVAVARLAAAAGLEEPDVGTRALGMAGAVAASPDDGLAAAYNPAGLAEQDGLRVTLDGMAAWQQVTFSRALAALDPLRPSVHSGGGAFFAPSAGIVSYGLGQVGRLQHLTLALGFHAPGGIGNLAYPADGAQRYQLVRSNALIAYGDLAVAAQVNGCLRLGVTGQLAAGSITLSRQAQGVGGFDPHTEVGTTLAARSGVAFAGVLAAQVTPMPGLRIGVAFRPHFTLAMAGVLSTEVPAALAALQVVQDGNAFDLAIAFPDVVRLGVALTPRPDLRIELDGKYEGWASLQDLDVHMHDIQLTSVLGVTRALPDVRLPRQYHNTGSVHLGGEWDAPPRWLTVRAGYMYEASAIPTRTTSVDFPNFARHVLGVGGSARLPAGFAVDVAFAHHIVPPVQVADSILQQVVAPSLIPGVPDGTPATVGNGSYAVAVEMVSLGLRYQL